jgi:hypothetical protein
MAFSLPTAPKEGERVNRENLTREFNYQYSFLHHAKQNHILAVP